MMIQDSRSFIDSYWLNDTSVLLLDTKSGSKSEVYHSYDRGYTWSTIDTSIFHAALEGSDLDGTEVSGTSTSYYLVTGEYPLTVFSRNPNSAIYVSSSTSDG